MMTSSEIPYRGRARDRVRDFECDEAREAAQLRPVTALIQFTFAWRVLISVLANAPESHTTCGRVQEPVCCGCLNRIQTPSSSL